jgi:hypothetical protein
MKKKPPRPPPPEAEEDEGEEEEEDTDVGEGREEEREEEEVGAARKAARKHNAEVDHWIRDRDIEQVRFFLLLYYACSYLMFLC